MRALFIRTALTTITAALMASGVMAQSPQPRLIEEARFGAVREVAGADMPFVVPDANCPEAYRSSDSGPNGTTVQFACFATLKDRVRADSSTRVIAFAYAVTENQRLFGPYGVSFVLYDLQMVDGVLKSRPVEYTTSDVRVPVGCFRLSGENVSYIVKGKVVTESQYVICDGGPRSPRGPYEPEGPVLSSQGNVYRQTEEILIEGTPRWLAYQGVCDSLYSPRKNYCATEAITYLQQNPDVKELDLIAARIPVQAGQTLTTKETDQWVLKRRGKNGFKADSRWNDQFWLGSVSGCWATTATRWHVIGTEKGLHIQERAFGYCGAPAAPVPKEIWEMYGSRDYFIVDCAEDRRGWRERRDAQDGSCLNQAGDYLRRTNQSSATVIVLNQRGRVGDLLVPGGYISYDVARASLNGEGKLIIDREDYFTPEAPYASNCSVMNDGPPESKGFILVRSMGVTFARSMRWMECGVY